MELKGILHPDPWIQVGPQLRKGETARLKKTSFFFIPLNWLLIFKFTLRDGVVALVAGGKSQKHTFRSAEYFDPDDQKWITVGNESDAQASMTRFGRNQCYLLSIKR